MTCQELVEFVSKDIALNPSMADSPIFAQDGGEIDGLGFGGRSHGVTLTHRYRPEHSERSKWEFFEAIFQAARIPVLDHWELANGYWPPAYVALRLENPWWLVKTPVGLIRIGWRKRVISIGWADTPVRAILTGDDQTTTDEKYCHAWPDEKSSSLNAVRYLRAFAIEMDRVLDEVSK